jgi:hypothetical protein
MSDENSSRPRTLGGGNADEPIPSSWPRSSASSGSRIGRIGGGGAPTCVSYHSVMSISHS